MNQKKILVVITVRLDLSGITAVLLRLAEYTKDRFRLSFALAESGEEQFIRRLEEIGKVFFLPSRRHFLPLYLSRLGKLASQEQYDIVHIHGNSATMALDLMAVRSIPHRITHVHNCAEQPGWKQLSLGRMMNRRVTDPVACSKASGVMMYNRPFTVITNGIDIERFRFNPEKRQETRKRLGLDKKILAIGHIGHFNEQKNQKRLISIFTEVLRLQSDARLILCGSGELLEKCKKTALNLKDKVIFVPETSEPEALYSAFDIFVLPSLFEGLPLVGIEAQASGLPCIFSDVITEEVQVLDYCQFVSLDAPDLVWAKEILVTDNNWKKVNEESDIMSRTASADVVAAAGYDAEITKRQVLELYG